ncbi:MAG TPA: hypothetical protein VJG83_05290 [archaeon]|nr:hypothetical protein [archaeon]
MENVNQKINAILERNARVETDKAWETSWTRRLIIALLTYGVIVSVMFSIKDPNPFFNALVPTSAFIISTSVLPFVKQWWLLNVYKK